MGLFKFFPVVIIGLLTIASCSKKITPGFYINTQDRYRDFTGDRDERNKLFGYLQLNDNGTFVYEDFFLEYNGDDVGLSHTGFFGVGNYKFNKRQVILNFDDRVGELKDFKVDSRFILPGSRDNYASRQVYSKYLATPRLIKIRKLLGPLSLADMSKPAYDMYLE